MEQFENIDKPELWAYFAHIKDEHLQSAVCMQPSCNETFAFQSGQETFEAWVHLEEEHGELYVQTERHLTKTAERELANIQHESHDEQSNASAASSSKRARLSVVLPKSATASPESTKSGASKTPVAQQKTKKPDDESRASLIIKAVQERPSLWQHQAVVGCVLDEAQARVLWNEVADIVGDTVDHVRHYWRSLRANFTRQYHGRVLKGGASNWSLYNEMVPFLVPCIQPPRVMKKPVEGGGGASKTDAQESAEKPILALNDGRSGAGAGDDGVATNVKDEQFVVGFLDDFSSMEQAKRECAMYEISIIMDNIGTSHLDDADDGAEDTGTNAMAERFVDRFLDAFSGMEKSKRERAMDEVRVVMYKVRSGIL